jgi:hypothetical protein
LGITLALLLFGLLIGLPLGMYMRRHHREPKLWVLAISPAKQLVIYSGGFFMFGAFAAANRHSDYFAIPFYAYLLALLQVAGLVELIVRTRIKFSLQHLMIVVLCVASYAALCRWLGALMIPISGVAGGIALYAVIAYDWWSRWPRGKQQEEE